MTGSFSIYLLCGEDEFAIEEFVAGLPVQIGSDPTIASMNTSQLDGRTHSYDDLVKAVNALPFLLDHRLVLFAHPTSLFKHTSHQKKLIDLMEKMPVTTLLILTDVEHVRLNYGKPGEDKLHEVSLADAKKYLAEGHFLAGSMGPKVKACVRFLEWGGKRAIITSLDKAVEALDGKTGTQIKK